MPLDTNNFGCANFHRKWAVKVLDKLLGLPMETYNHQRTQHLDLIYFIFSIFQPTQNFPIYRWNRVVFRPFYYIIINYKW